MSTLPSYGWNHHFEQHFPSFQSQGFEAARLAAIQGFKHVLISNTGPLDALLAGALLNSREPEALPKVGDWVVFKRYDQESIIIEVLPRINELSRKAPESVSDRQVLATNIDGAFIIQGLDRDFNLMRVQRYLQQVVQCGIPPIVVLNKADLTDKPETFREAVEQLGYQCPVLLTSALSNERQELWSREYLLPQHTYVLIGSSGVGKSTLLNSLLGYQLQQEGPTSTANKKGKHTTTSRNLVLLPNGSMIIDTPGMREFGLTHEEGAVVSYHPLIDELGQQCRFSDCTHQHEPGCAVIAAADSGTLPALVYRSYLKLLREQHHFQASAVDKKRHERQWGKISKQVVRHRKDTKY